MYSFLFLALAFATFVWITVIVLVGNICLLKTVFDVTCIQVPTYFSADNAEQMLS